MLSKSWFRQLLLDSAVDTAYNVTDSLPNCDLGRYQIVERSLRLVSDTCIQPYMGETVDSLEMG